MAVVSQLSKGENHMLIKFTSNVSGSVLMMGEHALSVLEAAGKKFEDGILPVRGVFTAQQLPAAIAALQEAISDAPPLNDDVNEDDPDAPKINPLNKAVSFKQRAYPLYEMLIEAQKQEEDVMWEPAESAW